MNARPHLPPPGPLPDSHALRARALAASWRRDRTVHRRRLAWRWVQWAFLRYGLPAMLGAAVLVLVVSQVMGLLDAPTRSPAPSALPGTAPQTGAAAAPAATEATPATATAAVPTPPATARAEADLLPALRFEVSLGTRLDTPAVAPPGRPTPASAPPSGPPDPEFRLQPDDYLHSKEP